MCCMEHGLSISLKVSIAAGYNKCKGAGYVSLSPS